MLEIYCLLHYDATDNLKNGILNNWLVNVKGQPGSWIERDLLQEHYNKWLEDLIGVHGGSFNDDLYRKTVAPNIEAFLRLKEEFESAFELKWRSKSHTSPHLRDEYHALLKMLCEEEVHFFRSKRSMGHVVVNLFDAGYCIVRGKIPMFINKSNKRVETLQHLTDLLCPVHKTTLSRTLLGDALPMPLCRDFL